MPNARSIAVRFARIVAPLVALALSGCGHRAARPAPPIIALVRAPSGFGNAAANAQALAGLIACAHASGARITVGDGSDAERQTTLFATEDADTVVGIGPIAASAIGQAARRFDSRHFVAIGAEVAQPNVESIVFDTTQAAFLAGAVAATVSKTGRVAVVGVPGDDLAGRMAAAFARGAASQRPGIDVGAFSAAQIDGPDQARAVRRAFAGRFDVVYLPDASQSLDSIDVTHLPSGYVIADAANEGNRATATVVARIGYRVDAATVRACWETVSQKPASGIVRLGLAQGAIALTAGRNEGGAERATTMAIEALARRQAAAANDRRYPAGGESVKNSSR